MRINVARVARVFSTAVLASLTAIVGTHLARTHMQKEQAVMCLAENIYHEGRGLLRGEQYLIGMITLARVSDEDAQWPKTICGAAAQDRQFSWVLDYKLATTRSEQAKWEQAKEISRDLIENAWMTHLLPRGWQCVRYYKRTDGKGVSKASMRFFETRLFPVGSMGIHTAYQDRRGCKTRLPTT